MSTLGFDRYVEPLKIYLAKYRDSVRGDRPEKKGGEEYGAQPKNSSHSGSMSGVSDAPIFAFDSTSGVMVRIYSDNFYSNVIIIVIVLCLISFLFSGNDAWLSSSLHGAW
jgi:hypothetical protein